MTDEDEPKLIQRQYRFSEDMELIDMVLPITALNYTSSAILLTSFMKLYNIAASDSSKF